MTPTLPNPPPPGADAGAQDALPAGTRFFELEVLRVLGVGGFGIVYLARDHSLERDVALKEYMPAALASRAQGSQVTVRSGSFAETYAVGLRSFVNEAKLLARFDHPSLVKVYRFWEANGTAYMVMPWLQGRTLREARRAMAAPPGEAWIRAVLDPVMDALERLHREEVYHRDIAPDNILLPNEGPPVLLDFGAARQVISGRTQSLTAILKPSYAPIEQYAEMAQLRQGPWTDIYALGAVMHFLLFGAPPSPATARAVQDDLGDLARRELPGVSPRLLATVAWALAVRPQGRPQDVAMLRAALDGRIAVPEPGRADVTVPGPTALMPVATPFEPTIRVTAPAEPDAPTIVTVPTTVPAPPARPPAAPPAVSRAAAPPDTSPAARRGLWPAVAVVLLVLVAAIAWWALRRPARTPAAEPTPAAVAAPAAATPVVPAPVVRSDPPATPAATPASPAPAAATDAASTPAVVAAPARPSVRTPRASRPAASRPAEPAVEPAAPRPAVPEPRPVPSPAAPAAAEPRPVPAPVPATAATPGPTSAREACGKRVFLALARCMEEQCQNPRFATQRDCQRVLEMQRRRDGG